MKVDNVPQDNISTYANNKKAIYASSEDGSVKVVSSSGWDAEEVVTKQALDYLEDSSKMAYCEVKKGLKSPLYFHMYSVRMDLQVLAESTGFFKWTIKRDFNPSTFSSISEKRLLVYADAMGKSMDELRRIEDLNYEC